MGGDFSGSVCTGQQLLGKIAFFPVQAENLVFNGSFQYRVWPILWALSDAWSSTAGFHQGSM